MKTLLVLLLLMTPWVAAAVDTLTETSTDADNNLPVGPMTREQILAFNVFNYWYIQYSPKADPVEFLHNYPNPLEVKVLFGDWCSDSKKQIPALIKVLEMAGNPQIHVSYMNLARKKEDRGPQLGSEQIAAVPTIIVSNQSGEMGRIVEEPKVSIEEDLSQILGRTPQTVEH